MNLDREISKKCLTDGFCLLYGEKYRIDFDSIGEELIELGIKNGRKHFTEQALYSTNYSYFYIVIKNFQKTEQYNSVDEFKSIIRKELSPFLTIRNINNLFVEQMYTTYNKSNFAYPTTKDKKNPFSLIPNILKNVIPTAVENIPSFDYFRQFPIYDKYKESVNLATDGGFGLDQFEYESVDYYLEENEHEYLMEAIPYKYHQLGSTLIREQLRLEIIDKIKQHITIDSDYWVKSILTRMVSQYCFDSEQEISLLNIP